MKWTIGVCKNKETRKSAYAQVNMYVSKDRKESGVHTWRWREDGMGLKERDSVCVCVCV